MVTPNHSLSSNTTPSRVVSGPGTCTLNQCPGLDILLEYTWQEISKTFLLSGSWCHPGWPSNPYLPLSVEAAPFLDPDSRLCAGLKAPQVPCLASCPHPSLGTVLAPPETQGVAGKYIQHHASHPLPPASEPPLGPSVETIL